MTARCRMASTALAVLVAGSEVALADRILVRNLPWSVGNAELEFQLSPIGAALSAHVAVAAGTGRSRGFGIVEMDCMDGRNAIFALDGQNHDGRVLQVQWAGDVGGNC